MFTHSYFSLCIPECIITALSMGEFIDLGSVEPVAQALTPHFRQLRTSGKILIAVQGMTYSLRGKPFNKVVL